MANIIPSGLKFAKHNVASCPCATSSLIASVTWDFANMITTAQGSDLFPPAWAPDGHIYVMWGDGTGFLSGDSDVAFGCGRIQGTPPSSLTYHNKAGGTLAENLVRLNGATQGSSGVKVDGMISVGGVFYGWMWMNDGALPNTKVRMAVSTDNGINWSTSGTPTFTGGVGNLRMNSILNFGQNNAGARDNYVYSYGMQWDSSSPWQGGDDNLYLIRQPNSSLTNAANIQYFAGLTQNGTPIWSTSIANRSPVHRDTDNLNNPSVAYNAPLNRYILTHTHTGLQTRHFSMFESVNPWGPWKTVQKITNWGATAVTLSGTALNYHFVPKWTSGNGKTMWCIFSGSAGSPNEDRFHLVKATLTTA